MNSQYMIKLVPKRFSHSKIQFAYVAWIMHVPSVLLIDGLFCMAFLKKSIIAADAGADTDVDDAIAEMLQKRWDLRRGTIIREHIIEMNACVGM